MLRVVIDAALVAHVQRTDHAASDELVDECSEALSRFICQITHDREHSERLLGATFLHGAEQIDRSPAANLRLFIWRDGVNDEPGASV
jgi:hypothetical protein